MHNTSPTDSISIHALREEGDGLPVAYALDVVRISIHALREEGDKPPKGAALAASTFLSTPSARRATAVRLCHATHRQHFYPRPPRGGRPSEDGSYLTLDSFLSTPSARRATQGRAGFFVIVGISIHALREEGDNSSYVLFFHLLFISIHALREEGDLLQHCLFAQVCEFLSTPSARRATSASDEQAFGYQISIHALREEGDRTLVLSMIVSMIFLSTPSARRATSSM